MTKRTRAQTIFYVPPVQNQEGQGLMRRPTVPTDDEDRAVTKKRGRPVCKDEKCEVCQVSGGDGPYCDHCECFKHFECLSEEETIREKIDGDYYCDDHNKQLIALVRYYNECPVYIYDHLCDRVKLHRLS